MEWIDTVILSGTGFGGLGMGAQLVRTGPAELHDPGKGLRPGRNVA
jgi:hypothetical protein